MGAWRSWRRQLRDERSEARPRDWNWRLGYGAAGRNVARAWVSRYWIGYGRVPTGFDAAGETGHFVLQHLRCGPFAAGAGFGDRREHHRAWKSGTGGSAGPENSVSLAAGDFGGSVFAGAEFHCG